MAECPYCGERVKLPAETFEHGALGACANCLNPYLAAKQEGGRLLVSRVQGVNDLRDAAQPGSVLEEVVRNVPAFIQFLPVFPEVPQRAFARIHDPVADINEIADILSEDPALSLQVVRLANSALYGSRAEFKNVHAAARHLGLRKLARVVVAACASGVFKAKNPIFRDRLRRLWLHSLMAAHCSQFLEDRVESPYRDGLYFAALVHCIGAPVLLNLIGDKDSHATARLRENPERIDDFLEDYYPVIGLHIALRWALPPEVVAGVYCHANHAAIPSEPYRRFALAVAVVDWLATEAGYPSFDKPHEPFEPYYLKELGLTTDLLEAWTAELSEEDFAELGAFVDAA